MKNKIESFAASQEDFPALLFKAKKYLIARGKLDWSDTPSAVPSLRRTETLGEGWRSWRRLGQGLGPGGQDPVEAQHGGLGAARFLGWGLGRGLHVALHGGLGAARGVGQGAGGWHGGLEVVQRCRGLHIALHRGLGAMQGCWELPLPGCRGSGPLVRD